VKVRGALTADQARWFDGFQITEDSAGNAVLFGEVADGSAFYGLMSRVRDLGLTVVSVERVQEDP
jgi:hypothetical protein